MCVWVSLNLLPNKRSLPVAHWSRFQASVRKGMVLSTRRETRFCYVCVGLHLSFPYNFFFCLNHIKGLKDL